MGSEGALDDCLRLLRGHNDEQRLVGLLLATKFIQENNKDFILKVFDAIGVTFIQRLLKSGLDTKKKHDENQGGQGYLELGLSILAAFCREPVVASLDEIISTVPLLVQVLSDNCEVKATVDGFECLLEIGAASEKGVLKMQKCHVLPMVARKVGNSMADTAWFSMAVQLMQTLLVRNLAEIEISEYAEDFAASVPILAEQLALLQSMVKFEILQLLTTLLASSFSAPILIVLKKQVGHSTWPSYVRTGIGQSIYREHEANPKHLSLELSQAMVEICGSSWLVGSIALPHDGKVMPADRFFLLLVETLNMETTLVLNELARLCFDESQAGVYNEDEIRRKQRVLASSYALLETAINIISDDQGDYKLQTGTIEKTMIRLNETIGVVFEFLHHAKLYGVAKGDQLLASTRLIGRYLADAPVAYRKEFLNLLQYLLNIAGENEERSSAIPFLLPTLSQVTMDVQACEAIASCRGHKQVLDWFIADLQNLQIGAVIDVCDILLNILLKKNEILTEPLADDFVPLLPVLADWSVKFNGKLELSCAASVCSCILEMTNEENLLQSRHVELLGVFTLLIRVLELCQQSESTEGTAEEQDLWEITLSACNGLIDGYPSLKLAIWSSEWLHKLAPNGAPTAEHIKSKTRNPALRRLLEAVVSHQLP